MKTVTGNRWWPAALVAALAVAGILAAFAALTAPGRDAAEAQSLCATATGEALRQLIAAGVCAEPSPTPAPGNTPTPAANPRSDAAAANPYSDVAAADSRSNAAAAYPRSDTAAGCPGFNANAGAHGYPRSNADSGAAGCLRHCHR